MIDLEYDKLNSDKEIGDWIQSNIREEFIKHFRLQMNMEIKFTKNYDLYAHRVEEWKNATPQMKHHYEEMKKNAQVEEYKFMERVLSQFNYLKKEIEIK